MLAQLATIVTSGKIDETGKEDRCCDLVVNRLETATAKLAKPLVGKRNDIAGEKFDAISTSTS